MFFTFLLEAEEDGYIPEEDEIGDERGRLTYEIDDDERGWPRDEINGDERELPIDEIDGGGERLRDEIDSGG